MGKAPLLSFTSKGIYCEQADVFIDPWRPVDKAIITHAHADHSRWGNKYYKATEWSAPIMKHRLGDINLETAKYGESWIINGVKFSFHPAGHVIGSAQVRVEYMGEVWVVSGDYKLENDGISTPFEPVKCNVFITECTFGLPVFKWKPQVQIIDEIKSWWNENQKNERVSVIGAYALGKAQRLIHLLQDFGPIYVHGSIHKINEALKNDGILDFNNAVYLNKEVKKEALKKSLVIAPNSAIEGAWGKKLQGGSKAFASGWMQIRGMRRRRAADRGFVLSDHADWEGLNTAIKLTGAEKIIVTHGYKDVYSKWLNSQGYDAQIENTDFDSESAD